MAFKKVRLALMRLPKNLRANRWWIFYDANMYFAHQGSGLALSLMAQKKGNAAIALDAKVYLKWTLAWHPRPRFRLDQAGIFIEGLGQFGNMTRRLASAICVAETLGLREVIVPKGSIFRGEIYGVDNHALTPKLTLRFGTPGTGSSREVKALWVEDFLRNREAVEIASGLPNDAWSHLRQCLVLEETSPELPSDHLVIHLRGGDVFQNRRPAGYGQPPLGFYTAILDLEKWSHVTIVREDELNPVTEPLVSECAARSIGVSQQSQSLQDDLRLLLSASSLVAGRGTFIPAVVGLSKSVRKVYYCEDKFVVMPEARNVSFIRGLDTKGHYRKSILSRNWQDSPEQRELMLKYPASHWKFIPQ